MKDKKGIQKLTPHEKNPRTLTKKQFNRLEKTLEELGDLSGVVYNVKNKKLIGGHMRVKVFDKYKSDIQITERFKEPDEQGTVALGYIMVEDKKFFYREVDFCEDKHERAMLIANRAGGDWDFDMLANHWDVEWLKEEIGFEDLDFNEVEKVEPEETEGDDEIPESSPPITVLGDIYELGGVHRVMCGDSLSSDSVDRLMDGQKAVLAHNDPPYGMGKENQGVENDNLNYDDLFEFNRQWIPLQFSHLQDNGSFYCWGIDEPLMDIYSQILKPFINTQKATFRNLITWNRGCSAGPTGSPIGSEIMRRYAPADEKCLFVMCGVQGFNDNADNYFEGWDSIRLYLVQEKEKLGLTNKELTEHLNTFHTHYWTTSQWAFPTQEHYTKLQELGKTNKNDAFKKEYDEIKKEYDEIKKEYYSSRAYFNNTHDKMTSVWDIARTGKEERDQTGGHATPKPLELCDRVINSSSREGDIVTDWFLGSGSTLISCEKLGRKCYGMELQPKYCDVIVKRYVDFCKKNGRSYSVKRNGDTCLDFE